jgi:hypothetical protein
MIIGFTKVKIIKAKRIRIIFIVNMGQTLILVFEQQWKVSLKLESDATE